MLGINDRRGHGILEFERARGQFRFAHRLKVKPQQRLCAAVEDVERGSRAGIDFEQKGIVAVHQEIR